MFFGGMPFGMGGDMPGMGGAGEAREPPNTTEMYEILGVDKDATTKQIKRAFMKIAAKEHPDKGGDADKFKAASEAYEILSDEKKRKAYDAGGKEGVERAAQGGGGGPDLASMFGFGGGGGRGRRKTRDHVYPVACTLERLAQGHTAKFAVTRDVLCSTCGASGAKPGASEEECTGCDGHGVVIMMARRGPFVQQVQQPCPECHGKGRMIDEASKCETCRGEKTTKEREVLEVHVDKGMKHGQKIKFAGKSDEHPDAEPGDLVFVVQQKEHPEFVRREADLIMKKKITLTEALMGVRFTVRHPDGRTLLVKSPEGETVAHESVLAVPQGGMPQYGSPYSRGNLYVKFEVEFPTSFDAAAIEALRKALPDPAPHEDDPEVDEDTEVEHVHVREVDVEAERMRRQRLREEHRDAYEEDDEAGGGARGVQCANQ
uniref:J domain-containing protein n=1 Tax=Bicosoecida sp. CB-2014 TaxID=1486930 RepID=A0A7S1CKG2_9STRA|mmetsp:Transcript_28044/g.97003  ORF Transcript_28044/g.97003 Transcript_28044/m.97003 type:complete len:431 (+) Transcript_28044:195-1487(+)